MPSLHHAQRVCTIAIGRAASIRLAAYGTALIFLSGAVFGALVGHGAGSNNILTSTLLALITYGVTLVVHELVHGLFFRLAGGRPTYGVGVVHFIPYAFATCVGQTFTLSQMLLVGLAPLVVISTATLAGALFVPTAATLLLVAFASNVSGAVGDMWLMWRLWQFRQARSVCVEDLKDSVAVYSADPRAVQIALRMAAREARSGKLLTYWLGGTLVVMALTVLISVLGPFMTPSLTLGPSAFPLVSYRVGDSSSGFSVGILPAMLAGLVFAVMAYALERFDTRQARRDTAHKLRRN